MLAMSTIPPTLVLDPSCSNVPLAGSQVSVHHRGQAPGGLPRGSSFVLAAFHSVLREAQWWLPIPSDSACRWNLTTTSTSSWNSWQGSLMTYHLPVISRTDHLLWFVDKGLWSLQPSFPWRPYPQSILWSMPQEALAWCSMHYKLNPWSEPALHQASSKTDAVSQGDQGFAIKISKFESIYYNIYIYIL